MNKAKQLAEKLKQYIPSGDGYNSEFANDLAEVIEYLSQDEQEPAAWVIERELKEVKRYGTNYIAVALFTSKEDHLVPIYTAPPKRKPLSDCDINLIIKKSVKPVGITRDGSTTMRIARAIEAAHGIGVEE